MESGAGYQVQTTSNWIEQDWWNLWSSQNRKRCRRPNMRCSKRNLREKNRTGKKVRSYRRATEADADSVRAKFIGIA